MKTCAEQYLSPMQEDSFLVREIQRHMLSNIFTNAGRFISGEEDIKIHI